MGNIEEVAIVGGGPAGSYCAYNLAMMGLKPIIFDHSFPREKVCAGGISPALIKKFPFAEHYRSKGKTFDEFKVISCVDTVVEMAGMKDGFCVHRRIFDQGILEMAINQGARHVKEKVVALQKNSSGWGIKTEQNHYSAKIVVGADGVNSLVRRITVGPISSQNLGLAFGYIVGNMKKSEGTIKFLAEIPGYIWVFPGKGFVNIGVGSELQNGSILPVILDNFIASHYRNLRVKSKYSAMLPSANDIDFFNLHCAGEDWILIGDAAGHVDPVSGEGLLYALWGGMLAAKAIASNNPKSFDYKWRREYGKVLIENCRNKAVFFDPLASTLIFMNGLANPANLPK